MKNIILYAKKSKTITNIYKKIRKLFYSTIINISPYLANKYFYFIRFKNNANIKNPKLFNEKIIWLKLYGEHTLWSDCTDKYAVRSYIKNKGYEYLLNELYSVYYNISQINWDNLPSKFVLKCTHGCGCNIICVDKNKLDKSVAIKNINSWLKTDYSSFMAEMHYREITPRIICEKFIETNDGLYPTDYKFYCFNGDVKIILVCTERDTNLTLTFFDLEWNQLPLGKTNSMPHSNLKKPSNLQEMISVASDLSKDFTFVRIDLYNCNGQIIFGEMTFTPAGGLATYYSEFGDIYLGSMLKLPINY